MKRLIKFTLYGVAVLASILLVGCTDDVALDQPLSGGESVVFNFVVDDLDVAIGDQGSAAATKAAEDDEQDKIQVKNMWIVQFDNAGKLLDKHYFGTFSTTDCVDLVDGVDDIVFIANTFSADLITDDVKNLDELKALRITELFGTDGAAEYFILNGTIENYDPKQGATVTLKRNIARVNIKVTESISYTLQDITVYNVPNGSPIYTNYTDAAIAATEFAEDIDITTDARTTDGATLYLPVNQQGTDGSITDSKDKPKSSNAKNATYVKVRFETDDDKILRTYTFYLGADMTENFNITANNAYYYTFSITSEGDVGLDARVEEEFEVTYIPIANAEDVDIWIQEQTASGNQKAIDGLKLEFINFEYSDYEVEGTNWRCDDRSLAWVEDYTSHVDELYDEYGIDSVDVDVDDDVLPALRTACGDNVNLPSQEELMYMWIFKGSDSFQIGVYWSSTVGSNFSSYNDHRFIVSLYSLQDFDGGLVSINISSDKSPYLQARAVREIILPQAD